VWQSDVRHSRTSGRTGNYLIYNETIPLVVRLSNHERNCDTVSKRKRNIESTRSYTQVHQHGIDGQLVIENFFDRYHPQDLAALRPLVAGTEPLYNKNHDRRI